MEQARCPVCGMDAGGSRWRAEHLGVLYRFCSEPCRESFEKRPRLYVGPLAEALMPVIKRRLRLRQVPDSQAAEAAVRELMGIRFVSVIGETLEVEYDLLRVQFRHIARALEKAGVELSRGWLAKMHKAWIEYTEENELDSLAAGEGACCNRPPAGS